MESAAIAFFVFSIGLLLLYLKGAYNRHQYQRMAQEYTWIVNKRYARKQSRRENYGAQACTVMTDVARQSRYPPSFQTNSTPLSSPTLSRRSTPYTPLLPPMPRTFTPLKTPVYSTPENTQLEQEEYEFSELLKERKENVVVTPKVTASIIHRDTPRPPLQSTHQYTPSTPSPLNSILAVKSTSKQVHFEPQTSSKKRRTREEVDILSNGRESSRLRGRKRAPKVERK